jgi:hypothetical protein
VRTATRWTAGLVVITLLTSAAVSIVGKGLDGNWLGVIFGVLGLGALVGAFVSIEHDADPAGDKEQ